MMACAPDVSVMAALEGRRSVRAFLPDPVPPDVVGRILTAAARAPSGSNVQPWQAYVLTGEAKSALQEDVMAAHEAGGGEHAAEYAYYPAAWRDPYLSRRRKVGWDLYGTLGIQRGDTVRMARQHGRNYLFFDAPVGMVFTIDRDLGQGSWMDYGFFLQGLATAARAYGLDTCFQAAFAQYHRILQVRLAIPAERMVVCGMALGHADPDAPENGLLTERAPLDAWVRSYDQVLPHQAGPPTTNEAAL